MGLLSVQQPRRNRESLDEFVALVYCDDSMAWRGYAAGMVAFDGKVYLQKKETSTDAYILLGVINPLIHMVYN